MKSSCPTAMDLDALLNGTLAPPSIAAVDEHLKECAACRQRLDLRAGNLDLRFESSLAHPSGHAGPVREIIRRVKVAGLADTKVVPIPVHPRREERPHQLGDYEIVDELGRGGMGIVYRARQVNLQREVALKVIIGDQLSAAHVRRFHVEAEAAGKLDHPHIVPIFEIGEHDGHHFFSMKLVHGRDLAQAIVDGRFRCTPSKSGALNRMESVAAARLMARVARAIHYAHQRGILHRDLKPSNILLDLDDQPLVTDFGLAKILERDSSLTHSAAVMGTPHYMAPEQALGKTREVTTAADVWSLGAVLYEMLTGSPPFAGETPLAVMDQVVKAEPVPVREVNPSAPRDLATISLSCLAKEPARRYRSAEALADDLERFVRGEPIRARPATQVERVWRWCRRQPALAGSLAALIMVFVAGFAGVVGQWRRAESHAVNERAERQRAEAALLRTQIERTESLFGRERIALPVAQLAQMLRQNPGHRLLASRLTSTLAQRNFCLPTARLRHDAAIRSARFSPSGRRVLTETEDGTASVWDVASGQLRFRLGLDPAIRQARFTPDGRWILAACADHTLRFWDAESGQARPVPPLNVSAPILELVFSPSDGKRFLTRLDGGLVQVWDSDSARRVGPPLRHALTAVAASFSADGTRVATVGGRGRLRVWDAETGEPLGQPMPVQPGMTAVMFTPDGLQLLVENFRFFDWQTGEPAARQLDLKGRTIASAEFSPDGQALLTSLPHRGARLWDVATGRPITPTLDHDSQVEHVTFSPDGLKMMTSSRDNTVRVWDARTGQALTEPLRHAAPVRFAQFSGDGTHLLTLPEEEKGGVLWLWEPRVLQPLTLTMNHRQPINSLEFSHDGKRVVTASADHTAAVWDSTSGRLLAALRHEDHVNQARFSADGRQVATASADGLAGVWGAEKGDSLAKLRHGGDVRTIEFSRDGRRLLSASSIGTARVWDLSNHQPIFELRHGDAVLSACFSPNGRQILTASADDTARLWDADTGRPLFPAFTHARDVVNAVFTRDGRRVVTVSGDGTARVWDVETGRSLLPPVAHGDPVRNSSPDLSRDGHYALTAAGNGAQVWDILTGRRSTPPLAHQELVHAARFNPGGNLVATVSGDRTAALWDSALGLVACEPLRHSGPVQWVEFSPDGRWVATASQDGVARLWEAPDPIGEIPEWLPELAEAMAGARLDAQGMVETVPPETLLAFRERLKALPSNAPGARWAQWLMANSANRRLSPNSEITLPAYIEARVQRGSESSLHEAALLNPTHALAHARIAQQRLRSPLPDKVAALAEADWHSRYAVSLAPTDPAVQSVRASVLLLIQGRASSEAQRPRER